MNIIKMVVFDMAGTTVKDNHEVEACFEQAALNSDLPFTSEEILGMMGWSKRLVFETLWKKALPEATPTIISQQVNKSYNLFTNILEDHYNTKPVMPTEGCLEMFDWLKQQDIKIALTTGFYRKVTNIILDRLGWLNTLDKDNLVTEQFHVSVTSDEVPFGRPEPYMIKKAMEKLGVSNSMHVINIGDTPSDLASGINAKCLRSYGVTNGTHTYNQLSKFKNDGLLDKVSDLKETIQNLMK